MKNKEENLTSNYLQKSFSALESSFACYVEEFKVKLNQIIDENAVEMITRISDREALSEVFTQEICDLCDEAQKIYDLMMEVDYIVCSRKSKAKKENIEDDT